MKSNSGEPIAASTPGSERISRRQVLARLTTTGGLVGVRGARPFSAADPHAHTHENERLVVGGQPAELSITAVTPHTLRVSILAVGADGAAKPIDEDLVLIPREWPLPAVRFNSKGRTTVHAWNDRTVHVACNPPDIAVHEKGGKSSVWINFPQPEP